MKIVWLSGWGIDPKWLESIVKAQYPQDFHVCLYPGKKFKEKLAQESYDALRGYSFGAFLILNEPVLKNKTDILISPFLDLKEESRLGGKVKSTQIKFLLRWIEKDPVSALNDFYQRSGLPIKSDSCKLPYPSEELIWGLETILNSKAKETDITAHIGNKDTLIDANRLRELMPKVIVHKNKSHNIEELLPEINSTA